MKSLRITTLSLLGAAVLAACSTVPDNNALLEQARSDYRVAQASGPTQSLASAELRQAGDALALANAAFARGDDTAQIDHLAYLARQRVALAQETTRRKLAEIEVAEAGAERDRLRLASRTREAEQATMTAAVATRDAEASQRESDAAQRQSMRSQRDAAASQQQAEASQMAAAASQLQAGDAERRALLLEQQLRELNAKKTERGLVVTIGDVLFDTGRAELKPGGLQNIQRLSGFLKEYPQRTALIEGYTDSVGGDDMNQALSARRANSVLGALLGMGVSRQQLNAQGYGETYPVAGNDSSGGRQMNRRVEIVLSDERGVVAPR